MSGLRLVLFMVNSDAGLGLYPRQPLSFFLGGAPVRSLEFLLLPDQRPMGHQQSAEEPEEMVA